MNLFLINKILNLWDPYGVIGLGPIDEYKAISLKVIDILKDKNNYIRKKLYNYLKMVDVLNTTNDTKLNEMEDLIVEIHEICN